MIFIYANINEKEFLTIFVQNLIKMKYLLILILFLLTLILSGQTKEVSFTLDDRDRLIRNEEAIKSLRNEIKSEINSLDSKINSLRNEMNYKFDSIQTQLNDLKTFLYWGFGILFGMMMSLFGFVLWDRRTTVTPVKRQNEQILYTLKEYSKENQKLAEILRRAGIL